MIDELEVIDVTHYGLNIYSHILRNYYPNEIVLELKGLECKAVRNPFNDNKPTLYLWQEDRMFFYNDTELEGFKGNPFDFAFLHFGLTGQPLLERLVRDMFLVVGQPKGANKYYPGKIPHRWFDDAFPRFTYFHAPISNLNPGPEITLLEVYKAIKSKKYEYITRELRMIKGQDNRRKYKAKHFNYVCFSGTFSKREDKSLKKHSDLMVIDIDHAANLEQLMRDLLNDNYFETQLMFISPSGDGLKWVIEIDTNKRTHLDWFNGVESYIKMKYDLDIDKSGKNVSRACYLCHDPEVYINEKYRF